MLGLFSRGKLGGRRGSVLREIKSGIGFVDVGITFSSGIVHLVELKVLRGLTIPGPAQIRRYMTQENRDEGWLLFFDARKNGQTQLEVQNVIATGKQTIRTIVVDINPVAPSRL